MKLNKRQIKRIKESETQKGIQILANTVARHFGYGSATEIKIGKELKVSHSSYGMATYSGKFYPGMTMFKWSKGGYYCPAKTSVTLPMNIVKELFF